jgi:hypothetical protein
MDSTKYRLMHALRWGRETPTRPFRSIPAHVKLEDLKAGARALDAGTDATVLWHAFHGLVTGVLEVESRDEHQLVMAPNIPWMAYDVLDRRLGMEYDKLDAMAFGLHLRSKVDEIRRTAYSPSPGTLRYRLPRDLVPWGKPATAALVQPPRRLPEDFAFDGITIQELRRFWTALMALGMVHFVLHMDEPHASRDYPQPLLTWFRLELRSTIQQVTDLKVDTIDRLLDLHLYRREHKRPDIALTPLVELGPDVMCASSSLLWTSNWERNFSAFVATQFPTKYANQTHVLAPAMAKELASWFDVVGLKTAAAVPIQGNGTHTDIDLLVWSEKEEFVLSLELKWLIKTADFAEIMNRAESTAIESVTTQLPVHAEALAKSPGEILQRAFRLSAPPRVRGHASMLVLRGSVGTSRVPSDRFPVVSDMLLLQQLRRGIKMAALCRYCMRRAFLPRVGRDFDAVPHDIVTPSGFRVRTYDWRLPDDPADGTAA